MLDAVSGSENKHASRKSDPRRIALAVRLYAKLQSGPAVAKRMDVSHPTVYALLRAGGVTLPDAAGVHARMKKLRGDIATEAVADYLRGMSTRDLRAKYGVGMWAIRTAARDAGVHMRNTNGRHRKLSEEDRAKITSLYVSGWSQAEIAAEFSADQPTIGKMLRASGIEMRPARTSGKQHGAWKGGRVRVGNGYIGVLVEPDDPLRSMADSNGYVLEHRLVMGRSLGRVLLSHETVHHINGDRVDNKLNNLQLRYGKHGKGVVMTCAACGSHDIVCRKLT